MPPTVIRGTQLLNNTVQRQDLDTSTVGQAVVTKIVQGTGVTLSSTGADSGTGDVTVSSTPVGTLPVGTVILYVTGGTPPASWMACDGSAISRATYPDLFTAIGTTYGAGDGSTTFNLPDLRGRVGVGAGLGTGLTNRVLAATGGEETHQLTIAELAAHTHTDAGHTHPLNVNQNWAARLLSITAGPDSIAGFPAAANTGTGNAALANTGSNTAHNTMQPFLVLFYIIKVSVTGGATAQAPIADTTQPGLMRTVSGNTTDFVDGTNTCQNLVTAVQPTIWSMRLRSLNAVGNPNFEVDQSNIHAVANYPAGNVTVRQCDRWLCVKNAATAALQAASVSLSTNLPGTNFRISQNVLSILVTTPQASLAAGEYLIAQQAVEGPRWRELAGDVHSVSLLAYCSISLNFSLYIKDPTSASSLVKMISLPAGVYTLITLPTLPNFSGGSFSQTPGAVGYYIGVCLGAGTTFQAPANDVWQAGNFLGFAGQNTGAANNFMATNGAVFRLAFIQHEPGALCTTPMDCQFNQNYDDCLRYYQKTYDYATAVGTVTATGQLELIAWTATTAAAGPVRFFKPMAKLPTVTIYNVGTGAAGSVRDNASIDHGSAAAVAVGLGGFSRISFATATSASMPVSAHYTADTGW